MKSTRGFTTLFFLGIVVISTGCQKAVPDLKSMGSLSGFTVDQSLVSVSSSTDTSVTISGQCHKRYTDVEISSDGGKTWKSAKQIASSVSIRCDSAGTFSINYNFSPSLLGSANSITFMVRGSAEAGFSDGKSVLLSAASTPGGGLITGGAAGNGLSNSGAGNFRLQGRVRALSSGTILSSSGNNYKLRGTLTAQ